MKRILVLLMALVMSLAVAGCGDDEGGSSKDTASATLSDTQYMAEMKKIDNLNTAVEKAFTDMSAANAAGDKQKANAELQKIAQYANEYRAFGNINNPPESVAKLHTELVEACNDTADCVEISRDLFDTLVNTDVGNDPANASEIIDAAQSADEALDYSHDQLKRVYDEIINELD